MKRAGVWAGVLVVFLVAVAAVVAYGVQQMRAVQAYLFGYPLVLMDLTRQVMTAGAASGKRGAGPVNQLVHARRFPDSSFRDVVAPNADTLYSVAWLDLSAGPLVLQLPHLQQRWVLMQVLDGWTNAHASPGTREYGPAARDYVITGPTWKGPLPAGMVPIASPTNMAWIIGRTYTRNAGDFAQVHALQDQYRLAPLVPVPPSIVPSTGVDTVTAPVRQVAGLGARAFYEQLAHLMVVNPPASADALMVATLAGLGLRVGESLRWDELDAGQRARLEVGSEIARAIFEVFSPGTQGEIQLGALQRWGVDFLAQRIRARSFETVHGWSVPLGLGVYGTNYAQRAIVALVGLGANRAVDAVYPFTTVDAQGQALTGARSYRIHFAQGQLPPAGAFWSLSLYDNEGFFVPNPIDRYAIGDRDELALNADGSLDLWIGATAPRPDRQTNWLPAPPGRFKLILRLYDPKPQVLDKRWAPPGVQAVPGG